MAFLSPPLSLSVNIKDTAGCSVLIKQVSVHKQLINKGRTSPLPDAFACLFPFYDRSVLHPAPLNGHKCLLCTRRRQKRPAQWHNCDTPSHAHLSCDPRGQLTYFWHWLGTRKQARSLLFNNSGPPVMPAGCDVIISMVVISYMLDRCLFGFSDSLELCHSNSR